MGVRYTSCGSLSELKIYTGKHCPPPSCHVLMRTMGKIKGPALKHRSIQMLDKLSHPQCSGQFCHHLSCCWRHPSSCGVNIFAHFPSRNMRHQLLLFFQLFPTLFYKPEGQGRATIFVKYNSGE
ncbi:hypothetical protein Mapa_009797 [Marchantia paleacea]|nr:hypothetical protein Mapa_009797 [Marchantia paleacea]